MYFGSSSIRLHLLKGLLGFAGLYVSLATVSHHAWPSVVLLPVVVYLFKGCFVCWTIGLIETIVMTVHKYNEGDIPGVGMQ